LRVAFWSYDTKLWGISSYLVAISVASVIKYPYSIVILESHLKSNNLGDILKNNVRDTLLLKEPSCNYYEGCGIEGLVRKIYRGDIYPELLNLYITEVLQDHLYYIPQSRVIHNRIFEYEFNQCLHSMISLLEQQYDLCFIDIAYQKNLNTKAILELSDLIVVHLSQNPDAIVNFVKNYPSIISKSLFLINKTSGQSLIKVKNIFLKYQIPLDRLVLIPDNEMLKEAWHGGELIDFISRYYYCGQEDPNYLFIRSIRKATETIMKVMETGLNIRSEEAFLCGQL